MQLTNSILGLLALGTTTLAHPSIHGHHRHHQERDVGDVVVVTMNGEVVSWVNEYSGSASTAVANVKVAAAATATTTDEESTAAADSTTTTAKATAATTTATATDSDGSSSSGYCTDGFGARTSPTTVAGNVDEYVGNVGNPWGSNMQVVDSDVASDYKYTVRFTSDTDNYFVSIWNKIGPDGLMDGWYGNSALNFTINSGEYVYVAFDENSQGGWGAAEGDSLPTNDYGAYDCTWGEFDFGDLENDSWSGFDVSSIIADMAGATVQGMEICTSDGDTCSSISSSGVVSNAYTEAEAAIGGIGGNLSAGEVRLYCTVGL